MTLLTFVTLETFVTTRYGINAHLYVFAFEANSRSHGGNKAFQLISKIHRCCGFNNADQLAVAVSITRLCGRRCARFQQRDSAWAVAARGIDREMNDITQCSTSGASGIAIWKEKHNLWAWKVDQQNNARKSIRSRLASVDHVAADRIAFLLACEHIWLPSQSALGESRPSAVMT